MDDINIVRGSQGTIPVFNGSAGEQVFEALIKFQDLPAEICAHTKKVTTYKQILEYSCQIAQAFQLHGLAPNAIVGLYLENCSEYMGIVLAAWYAGLVVAPLNFEYIHDELDHAINLSKPEVVFCSRANLQNIQKVQKKVSYINKIIVIDSNEDVGNAQSLDLFINCYCDKFVDVENFKSVGFKNVGEVALIVCSSGTTGPPKGVLITHSNLVHAFAHSMEPDFTLGRNPGTIRLLFAPRFHILGLLTSITDLLMGHCMILIKKYEPRLFLRCVQQYKIKALRLPPPVVVFLAKSPLCEEYDLSNLEEIRCGAAPISRETEMTVKERFKQHLDVRQAYGLTESTMAVTYNPKNKIKPGSCGIAFPGMSIKIVDRVTLKSLEPNKSGEIWVKGPLVTKGYINNPVATTEMFLPDGWLRTGDVGYYDEDGYLYITGRIKDLIKYKGFQVAPAELEALLLKHPKISDVGVIGIPNEEAGELPVAFVCNKEGQDVTEQEIVEFVSSQVSPQKRLRGGVRFILQIPKNSTGKILRRKLYELVCHKPSKL